MTELDLKMFSKILISIGAERKVLRIRNKREFDLCVDILDANGYYYLCGDRLTWRCWAVKHDIWNERASKMDSVCIRFSKYEAGYASVEYYLKEGRTVTEFSFLVSLLLLKYLI